MKRLALIVLLAAVPAFANTPGPGTQAVQTANDTIAKELKSKAPAADVIKSVNDFIDIDELGKHALGAEWAKLKPEEQKSFLDKLHKMIEANYVKAQTGNLDYTVAYTGESTDKAGNVVVKTELTAQKKGRPVTVKVDYTLIKQGTKLRAFDVITDDVSLVDNYGQQFKSIIDKKGFSGLLTLMDQTITKLQADKK